MGKIWAFIIAIASVYALINGRAEQLLDGILSIPEEAFSFLLIVLSSTIFWTGFMYIFKEVGIIDFISLAIKPLFKKIMPNLKDKEAIVTEVKKQKQNMLPMFFLIVITLVGSAVGFTFSDDTNLWTIIVLGSISVVLLTVCIVILRLDFIRELKKGFHIK